MIKIRLQLVDRNVQGVSVVKHEVVTEIPCDGLSIVEQASLIDPLDLNIKRLKVLLEAKLIELELNKG